MSDKPVALAIVGFGMLLLVAALLLRGRTRGLKLGAGVFGGLTVAVGIILLVASPRNAATASNVGSNRLGATTTTADVVEPDTSSTDTTDSTDEAGAGGEATTSTETAPAAAGEVSSYLADLQSVEGSGMDTGPVTINGATYAHSVSHGTGYGEADSTQYDLGRHYRTFTATVGLTDDSDYHLSVLFEVYVDEKRRFSAALSLGQAKTFTISVQGGLRLRLAMTSLKGEGGRAAWGDARITGLATAVPSTT